MMTQTAKIVRSDGKQDIMANKIKKGPARAVVTVFFRRS